MDPAIPSNDDVVPPLRPDEPASPESEDALMMQAMGFAAFGGDGSHPSKRRRYNPRTDNAVVGVPDFAAPTGANATAVAERQQDGLNEDEIDLDQDDDEGAPLDLGDAPALAGAQAQIEEMLAQEGGGHATLPSRPNPAWGLQVGRGGRGQGRRGGHRQQEDRGEPAKPWWDGYYDASSNENPWKALEEKAGLASKGTWIARGVKNATV
ncbi:hypothetical protein VDGD_07078 [Verticillium dahliae]|nr:hypothetical protein VDGD_07078 [Verticillium dahliae]